MMSIILRGGVLSQKSAVNILLYKNPSVEEVVVKINNLHYIPIGRPYKDDMAIQSLCLNQTVVLTVNDKIVYGQPHIFQYDVVLNLKKFLLPFDFSHASLFKYYETKF